MNISTKAALQGRGVVITRPADQAQVLSSLVVTAGGKPILFPLLEIAPLDDYRAFDAVVDRLDDCDWAIFISSNAVQHGMSRLLARRALPPQLRCAAIGPVTATELAAHGVKDVLVPAGRFDSENLLALPEMNAVAEKRCVVFRGVGGRELLAEKLRERGAEVIFAECYRRVVPALDHQQLAELWQNGKLHALVVTSSEALRNLLALAGDAAWLKGTPLFVNHARIAEAAASHGLHAVTADGPGDAGMAAALANYFRTS